MTAPGAPIATATLTTWTAALLLLLPSLAARAADAPAPRLVEEGRFSFVASGEFRPFSFVDENQELAGFDIDVGRALARELGLEPVPLKYKFAGIVEGVKTGRFDAAVASHTVTPERRRHVAFSVPYYWSGPQIFTRPGDPIEDAADLQGREVAVSKGSTYERLAREAGADVRVYDADVTALSALARGRHDAVVTDFVTGSLAIKEGMEVAPRAGMGRSAQAVAVAKDNPALLAAVNEALRGLRADGTLRALSERWFGRDITRPPEQAVAGAAPEEAAAGSERGPIAHFFHVLVESRGLFFRAALLTIQLTVVALLAAIVIGLVFAAFKLSPVAPLRWLAEVYIQIVRGTPLIVQIFILYFGLTDIVRMPAFLAASLALAFHSGAYVAEIARGAIQSIDRGQVEAGLSLGMPIARVYRRIVLPQATLRALPPLGNQFIIGLKDSSLAAFISMNELFNVATTQGANNFDQMTWLLVCAVYYLVLVLLLSGLVAVMERRLGRWTTDD